MIFLDDNETHLLANLNVNAYNFQYSLTTCLHLHSFQLQYNTR
jgi:hypothetical protein